MSVTGVNNILALYQYDNKIQRTGTRNDVMLHKSPYLTKTDFAKQLQNTAESKQSFQDMWQTRFSGAYYHVMNAYKISQGVWEREDFPFEKFFQNEVDDSVLEWQPVGRNPDMTDSSVQARLRSIRGQKSIVVPPELEEKMKNNPELTKSVMAKVEDFITTDQAMTPDRICSYLIVLDENGEIARYRASSGGGFSGPTEEEQRQFLEERKEEAKKAAEYRAMLEESALKRSAKWQEIHAEYYRQRIYDRVLENYESGTLL